MCKYAALLFILAVALSCVSAAGAYTLTFDDVPAGTNPLYYCTAETPFCAAYPFAIEDHSAASWGPPHSAANVLVCNGAVGEIGLQSPPFNPPARARRWTLPFLGHISARPARMR